MGSPRNLSAEAWISGRSIADLRVSPTAASISFLSRVGSVANLVILPATGGVEQVLPLAPPASGGGHDWLPDSSGIVYVARGRIYQFTFDTLECRPLTPEGVAASQPVVSRDGSKVAYVVDDMVAIASVSLIDESWPQLVSVNAEFATDPSWSPDGSIAWVEWNAPSMPWDESRVMVRTPTGREMVAGGNNVSVQQPRFSPDGSRLAYLSDEFGWLNLWITDTANYETLRPVVQEHFEHSGALWGSGSATFAWLDNSRIVFSRNDGGWWRILQCDVATGDVSRVSDAGASRVVAANGVAVVSTIGPKTPSEIVSYKDGVATTLARSTAFGIERAGVEPQAIDWQADDGTTIHGRIYQASPDAPMLVWTHGGPTDQSPATLHHRFGYFVERGWSILVVDHRGSTGWGREYTQAMRGRWGELDVSDSVGGVRAAIESKMCDPSKVVAIGGSAGGFTSLHLVAKHRDLFAAAVVQYPVSDLVEMNTTSHRFEAHYNDSLVGRLPEAYDDLVVRSPVDFAESISVPVLILQGTDDAVVAVQHTRTLVNLMQRSNSKVEYHEYESEGHGWRKPETRVDELVRIETFLRKHVLHVGSMRVGP